MPVPRSTLYADRHNQTYVITRTFAVAKHTPTVYNKCLVGYGVGQGHIMLQHISAITIIHSTVPRTQSAQGTRPMLNRIYSGRYILQRAFPRRGEDRGIRWAYIQVGREQGILIVYRLRAGNITDSSVVASVSLKDPS